MRVVKQREQLKRIAFGKRGKRETDRVHGSTRISALTCAGLLMWTVRTIAPSLKLPQRGAQEQNDCMTHPPSNRRSASVTARAKLDLIGLGSTPGQRAAELLAGLRAVETPSPEAV